MKLNNNDLQSFEELPQGWAVTTLGKILPLTYGKALKKETRDGSGSVPVYGSSGRVGVHSNALTKKPALIVGRKGSVGEVYHSPVPCWPIDTVYFAEESEDGDLKYFEYLLKGLRLSKLDKSTAVPGLSRDDYNAVEVAIAPLDQQKRIVAEIEKQFSRLDEGVANLKRVKANLKRYKAAVLKAAVEGRLVETEAELARREGRSYETGEQLLQRILETRRSQWQGKGKYKEPTAPNTTDLPGLPEGWVWATLNQIGQEGRPIIYGIIKPGPHDPNGVPYVRVTEMKDGFIDLENLRRVTPARAAKFARATLAPGDVLISKDGTIGRVAVVPSQLAGGNITQHVMRAPINELMCRDYVVWAIRSDSCQKWLTGETKGVALRGVNVEDFRRLPIPVPPVSEQERILAEVGRRLTILHETEAQVDSNLMRAENTRKSMLGKAFSGGLVTDLQEVTGRVDGRGRVLKTKGETHD
ncbi:MAG: restriction endonuclease subunit S [Gammaproteobacteria bacterium]|nr:restriction endonuclease subunit S [Gammaproteobacteria bacterium]